MGYINSFAKYFFSRFVSCSPSSHDEKRMNISKFIMVREALPSYQVCIAFAVSFVAGSFSENRWCQQTSLSSNSFFRVCFHLTSSLQIPFLPEDALPITCLNHAVVGCGCLILCAFAFWRFESGLLVAVKELRKSKKDWRVAHLVSVFVYCQFTLARNVDTLNFSSQITKNTQYSIKFNKRTFIEKILNRLNNANEK